MCSAVLVVVSEMKVPRPTCASSSPLRRASVYARVTVVRSTPSVLARARCVGICWPRASFPLATSAASASTIRRKTGPCHSESVGSQSIQLRPLFLNVWPIRHIVWISQKRGIWYGTSAAGFAGQSIVARIYDELSELQQGKPVRPVLKGLAQLPLLRRRIVSPPG